MTDHAALREVLAMALDAASNGDVAGQLAHYTDDAIIEVAFADPPLRFEGREQLEPLLTRAYATNGLRITIDEVVACAEPDQLVAEFHADGVVHATGETFAKQYIARFWFRDGQIARQREFAITR